MQGPDINVSATDNLPLAHSYERLGGIAVSKPSQHGGIVMAGLIWLHEEALRADHPVFAAGPGATALFCWDIRLYGGG